MVSEDGREHWERQADRWIALTQSDPHYDLFNKPTFLDLVPQPGRVTLDVGCGEGRLARELLRLGHRVVALDGSTSLANAAASGSPPVPVGIADASRLPVASASADLVVCFMVLMDVDDLDQVVSELSRVLIPGGVLSAAILHPIMTSGLFMLDDPHQTFYMGEYLRPMRHILEVERSIDQRFMFRVEHRPIERYSRAFERAGLVLTHLREPLPSKEAVNIWPELAKFRRVPEFLHLRAERHR